MNDETAAATAPALTTVEETLKGSGRADVLNQFARLALGQQPEAEPQKGDATKVLGLESEGESQDAEAKAKEADAKQDDLSQSNAEEKEVEPESKDEGKAEDEEAELTGKLDEHTQQKINKRIAKEVAKTKAERERAEQLETRLKELEAKAVEAVPAPVPTQANPLAHITDVKQLVAERAKAEEAREQAEELLDTLQDEPERVEAALRAAKVELKDELGAEDFSVNRMKQFLKTVKREARNVSERAVPQQAQYLDAMQKSRAMAEELVPELKDAKSPRSQKYQEVLKAFPEIRSQPWWPMAAAVQVVGLEALEAQRKASATPVAKAKPPLPVKIPAPKAAPNAAVRKPNTVDDDTYSRAVEGDKNARLKVIQSMMPKFG